MIKSPIQKVTNQLQFRAIGIVNGTYNPLDVKQFNRGILTDNQGTEIDTVVLGKALSLIKKYTNLENSYFWIVYPKNKSTQNLHLQVVGIWDPYQFNKIEIDSSEKDHIKLLEEMNLKDNYFSIRGELVYINTQKKEFVIKICSSPKSNKVKNKKFKLVIKGELSQDLLNDFISLDVIREGHTLKSVKYEVIQKNHSKKIILND